MGKTSTMNKVVRFRGNASLVPKEAANLYVADGQAILIDQTGNEIVLGAGSEMKSLQSENEELSKKVAWLEEKVAALAAKDAVPVSDASGLNQPDNDIAVSIDTPVQGVNAIAGKTVDIDALPIENGLATVTAKAGVEASGIATSGNLPKGTSNAQFSINAGGPVSLSDSEFNQTSYNCAEIGLSSTPGSVRISGVDFGGPFSNNVVSVFDTTDNAAIVISDCHFGKCSNPLRISNRSGNKVSITIENCVFDEWNTGDYAGLVIFQDYTSKSAAEARENNLFGPEKVEFKIVNCTYGGRPIAMPEDGPRGFCATADERQLAYVYADKEGIIPYSAERYPKFTVE